MKTSNKASSPCYLQSAPLGKLAILTFKITQGLLLWTPPAKYIISTANSPK
jgi:hypothetical protein